MNDGAFQKIQPVLDSAVNDHILAGMNLLVYKDGKEVGYWQAGFADRETGRKYSRDTICRLYSMTKPVTAVAAMILVEDGLLDIGEPVSTYLPAFADLAVSAGCGRHGAVVKAQRPVLIQDLLNMTSGYTYGNGAEDAPVGEILTADLLQELNADTAGKNSITTQQVAVRLAAVPLSFEPGTAYNYGLSADILGAVIEQVSGMKFSGFLKKKIFDPLGMNDTDFWVPSEKQPRLAKVYKPVCRSGVNSLELFTDCRLGIQDKMDHAPAFESGGAGLCSTADDYMRFARMLVNGGELDGKRVLQPKTVSYLASARLSDRLQQNFDCKMEHLSGYTYCNLLRVAADPGKCKAVTETGEFGWDGWLGPYMSVDLKNDLAFVVTMQRTDSGTISPTRRIKNILYTSL